MRNHRNNRSKGRVLVIEDDPSTRETIRILLRKEAYEVFVAPNGVTAIELLETVHIQTIVLEPWLRGIQGRELLTQLRRVSPESRVIMVTGHRLSLWFDDTVRDEVFDYLPKPFATTQLTRSVARAMRQMTSVPPRRAPQALELLATRR